MSDVDNFDHVKKFSEQIKANHGKRVKMQDEMAKIYLMDVDEGALKGDQEGVKVTLSPKSRNKLQGALRLLIATEPDFSLDAKQNSSVVMDMSDQLEKAAERIFKTTKHYHL